MEDPDRFFAAGRGARGGAGGEKSRQDPLHRLHRPQGSGACICACWTWRRRTISISTPCQMPLNVLDCHFRSFAHQVVPRLVKQGIGVLGMKPMAFGDDSRRQASHADRVPALRAQSADFGGHHRLRFDGTARSGARGRAHIQALNHGATGSVCGKDQGCALTRKIRALQDDTEFDGTATASRVDGIARRAYYSSHDATRYL